MQFDEDKAETSPPEKITVDLVDLKTRNFIAKNLVFYLMQYQHASQPTYVAFSPEMDATLMEQAVFW